MIQKALERELCADSIWSSLTAKLFTDSINFTV